MELRHHNIRTRDIPEPASGFIDIRQTTHKLNTGIHLSAEIKNQNQNDLTKFSAHYHTLMDRGQSSYLVAIRTDRRT
jgi:hypothetical protein